MKQPRILHVRDQLLAGQRRAFASNPGLKTPYDLEVEAVWFALTDATNWARIDDLLRLNFAVKGWPQIVPGGQPIRASLLGTLPADRTRSTIDGQILSSQAWYWRFRYAYRLLKDSGLQVQVLNQIPVAGNVIQDAFTGAFHCVGRDEVPHKPRVLVVEGNPARAAQAPVPVGGVGAIAAGSNMNDGREELDVMSVSFARQINSLAANTGTMPDSRRIWVQVRPTGKDEWSDNPVPLAAYGVHRMPDDDGIWWVPGGNLVMPKGVSPDIDVVNGGPNASWLDIAILGYVDIDEPPETEQGT